MNVKTRSPLKDKPYRYVAQSTDETIDDLVLEKILGHYTVVVIILITLAHEWQRYDWPLAKRIILMIILGGGVCNVQVTAAIFYIKKVLKDSTGKDEELPKEILSYQNIWYVGSASGRTMF